ncbi:hypothetical protein BKA61DRAFT_677497 [Leptodontidium sp. MPI-SDFR-AT-0119]|nr:hypothetical protein BKA61DRAFT_677497 [Leptodontidium sp. MPI-SDFR-AT-0119]
MFTPVNRPMAQSTMAQGNSQHEHLAANVDANGLSSSPMPVTIPIETVKTVGFTLFPRLPLELRRKVWREAIIQRTIYILNDRTHKQRSWKVITSAISLLSVNTESRSEGLKLYEQPSNTRGVLVQGVKCRGSCYVNFAHDLIYMEDFRALSSRFHSAFAREALHGDKFMNVALNRRSLFQVQDNLKFILNSRDCKLHDPEGRRVWKLQNKLQYIRELVLAVDHLRRNNPNRMVIGDKTSRSTQLRTSSKPYSPTPRARFRTQYFQSSAHATKIWAPIEATLIPAQVAAPPQANTW